MLEKPHQAMQVRILAEQERQGAGSLISFPVVIDLGRADLRADQQYIVVHVPATAGKGLEGTLINVFANSEPLDITHVPALKILQVEAVTLVTDRESGMVWVPFTKDQEQIGQWSGANPTATSRISGTSRVLNVEQVRKVGLDLESQIDGNILVWVRHNLPSPSGSSYPAIGPLPITKGHHKVIFELPYEAPANECVPDTTVDVTAKKAGIDPKTGYYWKSSRYAYRVVFFKS